MIEVHYAPTPNGHKVTIYLEETGTPYSVHLINILTGEQFSPEFLKISPNNRIPAIIDKAPADGGASISVFESGAILEYLGEKIGRFYPKEPRARAEVQQWLHWQMAGLGPMAGQANHFLRYAPETLPYAQNRYRTEVGRLYAVLDRRLADRQFVAGDYSIADMAIQPWIALHEMQEQKLEDTPNVKRWFDEIAARPAVKRANAEGDKHRLSDTGDMTEEGKKIMFGQGADVVEKNKPSG